MVTATAMEENGEFCVTVGPVTRTVGILTLSSQLALNWAGHPANFCASLIGFHRRRVKCLQGISSIVTDLGLGLYGIFLYLKPAHVEMHFRFEQSSRLTVPYMYSGMSCDAMENHRMFGKKIIQGCIEVQRPGHGIGCRTQWRRQGQRYRGLQSLGEGRKLQISDGID